MKNSTFEELYKKYSSELYLYAFALCKNEYTAQELVSDTFYKVLLSLDDERIEIKYWLFRVCKNIWIDSLRRKRREFLFYEDDVEIPVKDDCIDNLIVKEKYNELYKQIMNLSLNYRVVIILYYFCNMPLKVISEHLNMSPGAVRTLIFRARQSLKNYIKEDLI